ncbi:MAG: hypothetical protein HC822_11975 [Oscillochloris sp.]|nr:hypothetical protein [Oscillochloris sp.]
MTQAEKRLIEEGWEALVERLGLTEATRFVMLLERRTGGAVQHLRELWSSPHAGYRPHHSAAISTPSVSQFDA